VEFDLLISFFTLSLLEIVLGIDNLIFIALLCDQLPPQMRFKARLFGLALALVMRVTMLFSLSWIMKLTEPVFNLGALAVSWKDMLLFAGGWFLIYKAGKEMWADAKGQGHGDHKTTKSYTTLRSAILQIVIIDFVFSFDSIITAVGLTDHLGVMVAAVVVSMIVMLFAAGKISEWLHAYPNFKMLALGFVLAIGVLLVFKSVHIYIDKNYLYFAIIFSIFCEVLNTMAARARKRAALKEELKIHRHEHAVEEKIR
jgi:predicted tellurium resistance membrane protein TerC